MSETIPYVKFARISVSLFLLQKLALLMMKKQTRSIFCQCQLINRVYI